MNRKELIEDIRESTGIPQKTIDSVLKAFFRTVESNLTKREDTKIVGFGTFSISDRSSRRAVNPATKEYMTVPAKSVPVFKFATNIKEEIAKNGF